MKLRQVEAAIGPIDRDSLIAREFVEGNETPYIMQSPCREYLATNLWTGENASLQYAKLFRIRITGEDDDGKLTWKRIPAEPKPVDPDDLACGALISQAGTLCVVHVNAERILCTALGIADATYFADAGPCYRARIVGFEDGELLWETC